MHDRRRSDAAGATDLLDALPDALLERCARELTPETRLAILRIKDIWHRHPTYRHTVLGVDVYTAVLNHGVRSPDAFAAYLHERGKMTDPAGS